MSGMDTNRNRMSYIRRFKKVGNALFRCNKKSVFVRRLLLTGVFPFDVGQVGRARVADGQTLLGHPLVAVHVHEVSVHRDLRARGGET